MIPIIPLSSHPSLSAGDKQLLIEHIFGRTPVHGPLTGPGYNYVGRWTQLENDGDVSDAIIQSLSQMPAWNNLPPALRTKLHNAPFNVPQPGDFWVRISTAASRYGSLSACVIAGRILLLFVTGFWVALRPQEASVIEASYLLSILRAGIIICGPVFVFLLNCFQTTLTARINAFFRNFGQQAAGVAFVTAALVGTCVDLVAIGIFDGFSWAKREVSWRSSFMHVMSMFLAWLTLFLLGLGKCFVRIQTLNDRQATAYFGWMLWSIGCAVLWGYDMTKFSRHGWVELVAVWIRIGLCSMTMVWAMVSLYTDTVAVLARQVNCIFYGFLIAAIAFILTSLFTRDIFWGSCAFVVVRGFVCVGLAWERRVLTLKFGVLFLAVMGGMSMCRFGSMDMSAVSWTIPASFTMSAVSVLVDAFFCGDVFS